MGLKKKLMGSLLTLVLVISLIPMTVLAAPDKLFQITSVVYSGEARTPSEEFSTITEIVYIDDGVETTLPVGNNEIATLTVDGIQYDIVEGASFNYNYEAVINLTKKDTTNLSQKWGPGLLFSPLGLRPFDPPLNYYFRASVFINEGNFESEYSILKSIISGTVNSTEANNVVINSQGSYFNGFYINNTDYAINELNLTMNGNGGDDFSGWGAGVMTTGTSGVTIDDAIINTTGAIRTAIWAGGDSNLRVTDSVITAYGADTSSQSYQDLLVPMLKRVPWVLGLEGTTRATNVLGGATANYEDSIIVSENWGALSTDSGKSGTTALNVSDVLAGIGYIEEVIVGKEYDAIKTVNGVDYGFTIDNSGYVTYADAGVINNYHNVEFFAPDYIIILASMTSSANFTGENTVAVSDRIGAMWHQNKNGTLSLIDGSWTAADTMFLVKAVAPATEGQDNSAYPNLIVEGTEFNINGTNNYSGVLYQLMDSDDAGGPFITGGYTIPAIEDNWAQVEEIETETTASDATFKNINTIGDIYNSVYTVNEDLNVTFEDSTITGVISSSNANHVDEEGKIIPGGTVMSMDDEEAYLFAGRIINTASAPINNDVNLTLKDSTWVVTGTSYLSTISIGEGSKIIAEDGYKVKLSVDGKEVSIATGDYSGNIVIERTAIERPAVATNNTITSVKTGDATQIFFWIILLGSAVMVTFTGIVLFREKII